MTKVQQFRAARLRAEYRDLLKSIESVKQLLLTEDFTGAEDWNEDNGSNEYNGLQTILATMMNRKLAIVADYKAIVS
jgi:hypothetical protein